MKSKKSPLLGYNHNMKYKGRIYHVQTEDSGLKSPHVFTHLFHDGIIVSTKKADYHHLASKPDWEVQVRELMQQQHKDMMKELVSGVHNEKIVQYFKTLEVGAGEDEAASASQSVPALPPSHRASQPGSAPPQPHAAQPQPAQPHAAQPQAAQPHAAQPQPAPPAQTHPPQPAQPVQPSYSRPAQPAQTTPARPAQPAQTTGARPAPPAQAQPHRPAVVAMPMVVVSGQQPAAPPEARKEAQPEDPAAVYQPHKSKAVPESIFSGGVVKDEKSLDEVILAYLAEDLPDE